VRSEQNEEAVATGFMGFGFFGGGGGVVLWGGGYYDKCLGSSPVGVGPRPDSRKLHKRIELRIRRGEGRANEFRESVGIGQIESMAGKED